MNEAAFTYSCMSTKQGLRPPTTEADFSENLKTITRELKEHVDSAKKKQLTQTVNQILTTVLEEDMQNNNRMRNRKSVMDDLYDNLNFDFTKQKLQTNKKKFRATVSLSKLEKRSMASLAATMNTSMVNIHLEKEKMSRFYNFYEKGQMKTNNKNLKLEKLRNKKRIEERENFTEKPTLSKNTQKIIKSYNEGPLYLRTQEVIEKKNNYLEQLKRVHKKEDPEEATNNRVKVSKEGVEDFLTTQKFHQRKKEERLEKIKDGIKNSSVTEDDCPSFKPIINKTSEYIVSLKTQQAQEDEDECYFNLPAHERLYNGYITQIDKITRVYNETAPTFSPFMYRKEPNYLKTKPSFLYKTGELGNFDNNEEPINAVTNANANANANAVTTNFDCVNVNGNSVTDLGRNKSRSKTPLHQLYTKTQSQSQLHSQMHSQHSQQSHKSNKSLKSDKSDYKNLNNSAFEINPEETRYFKHIVPESFPTNKEEPYINNDINSLYKLNVNMGSVWEKNRENKVIVKPKKFSMMLKKMMK